MAVVRSAEGTRAAGQSRSRGTDDPTTVEVFESQRDSRKLARHEVSGWTYTEGRPEGTVESAAFPLVPPGRIITRTFASHFVAG